MAILKAILGPTNTGKTHYAIERMLGYSSGMIGLPLRLLAREVYDRIVTIKGERACALITGEERIEPDTARYHVCTVESMPMTKQVSFMAVDEIQIAEDRDRGHVFTDRILHARGTEETLLLGADTMRPVLRELDLNAETETRERFSELTYAGPIKVTKLPKRSAIVAFSTDEVYAIAELLRRQKGGAAVVMGALSPRTRNAQVELYQSGEVDYIVATDAIGMGLNLDVDHVAFAARTKFDGRRRRQLSASECAQIAGRAGRFRDAGTFGETGDCPLFDEAMVRRIENHNFEPVDTLQWRNTNLDYNSLNALIDSLSVSSGSPVLRQNPDALDEWTLRRMSEDEAIGPNISGAKNVRRLWDLARLPDFRKAGHDGHARLVLGLAETLQDPDARLGDAAMAQRLEHLAMTAGDISKLQERLAAIRTWSYVAHREDWLANPQLWRDKTRAIEDNLSDALHEALTDRFVDRRTTALIASLNKEDTLVSDITSSGEVSVEGHVVGRLVGLKFEPVSTEKTLEGKTVRGAAQAALKPILARRLEDIASALPAAFTLAKTGEINFDNEIIARLVKGKDWLAPSVSLIGAEDSDADLREKARARIEAWTLEEITRVLPTHFALAHLKAAETLEGLARGIAFRLMETGAAVDLRLDDPSHRITTEQREALKAVGLRAGRVAAHVPDAQKPAAQLLISILRSAYDDVSCTPAPEGAGSFPIDETWTDAALSANGYLRFGGLAVRADLAERLGWEISKRRKEAGKNAFALPPELASIVSCPGEDFAHVLSCFGLAPAERD
ncbi:MAG: helicase-related protein, partial [Hyphomonadaceae bacterium]